MTTITFGRPTIEPLHRSAWIRPASGAGADDFRVTQHFDDPDFYWKGIDNAKYLAGHRATDIGNGRCSYPLIAMHGGRTRRLRDNATAFGAPTDALGIEIDCGHAITLQYWHLERYAVPDGATVSIGQIIGYVGKTGLGQVCHSHIEARSNGIRFDPEPLMFGGSITVGDVAEQELDMRISGKFLRHIQNRRGVLTVDANFRRGVVVGEDAPIGDPIRKGAPLFPIVVVEGRPVGTAPDKAEWYGALAYRVSDYWFGYVHSSVLPRTRDNAGVLLEPIEFQTTGGVSEAEYNAVLERIAVKDRYVADYPKG